MIKNLIKTPEQIRNITDSCKYLNEHLYLSVNDCVVHGIPDHTILKNGDLLKIDAGIIYKK